MFSKNTQDALLSNLRFESGINGLMTLNSDVYRELVLAARKFDAISTGQHRYSPRLTTVGAGDGNTFVIG